MKTNQRRDGCRSGFGISNPISVPAALVWNPVLTMCALRTLVLNTSQKRKSTSSKPFALMCANIIHLFDWEICEHFISGKTADDGENPNSSHFITPADFIGGSGLNGDQPFPKTSGGKASLWICSCATSQKGPSGCIKAKWSAAFDSPATYGMSSAPRTSATWNAPRLLGNKSLVKCSHSPAGRSTFGTNAKLSRGGSSFFWMATNSNSAAIAVAKQNQTSFALWRYTRNTKCAMANSAKKTPSTLNTIAAI